MNTVIRSLIAALMAMCITFCIFGQFLARMAESGLSKMLDLQVSLDPLIQFSDVLPSFTVFGGLSTTERIFVVIGVALLSWVGVKMRAAMNRR